MAGLWETFPALQRVARSDGEMVSHLLWTRYRRALIRPDEACEVERARARALLHAVAELGRSQDVAACLRPGCDENVIYSLAVSCGIRLHRQLSDDARYSPMVPVDTAIEILSGSPLVCPWSQELRRWRDHAKRNVESRLHGHPAEAGVTMPPGRVPHSG